MPRYAVRLYYEGKAYHGFQPQKDRKTVGGEVLSALLRSGLVRDRASARFQAASRTDRGANALSQTVAFYTEQPFTIRRLNAFLPSDIRAWAWAEVSTQFNPRREAVKRRYLYLASYQEENVEKMKNAARFLLREVPRPRLREEERRWLGPLEKLKVKRQRGLLLFELTSKGFGRGAVRKTVSLLLKTGRGELQPESLRSLLQKEGSSLDIAPAPPENLLLSSVEYRGIRFRVDEGAVKEIAKRLEETVRWGEFARLCLARLPSISGQSTTA